MGPTNQLFGCHQCSTDLHLDNSFQGNLDMGNTLRLGKPVVLLSPAISSSSQFSRGEVLMH